MKTQTMNNVSIPFFAEVRDGIPRGSEIEVEGHVLTGGDQAIWFEFRNFDGIPFHLNIRLGYQKEHTTVLNSYERGRWQREERHGNNVSPGGPILLIVSNHLTKWEIKINGQTFTFPHRLSFKDIRRFEIRGAIQVNRLTFKNLEGHIDAYQTGGQPHFQPQPNFNPGPYAPEAINDYTGSVIGADPGLGQVPRPYGQPGLGQTMGGPPEYGQPTPNQGGFGQPNPNQGFGQPNQMYPPLHYGGQQPGLGQSYQPNLGQPGPNQGNDPRGYY